MTAIGEVEREPDHRTQMARAEGPRMRLRNPRLGRSERSTPASDRATAAPTRTVGTTPRPPAGCYRLRRARRCGAFSSSGWMSRQR